MNHEDEALAGAFADTIASAFTLTSAMHLTIVNPDYESPADLNHLRTSGFYLSRNKAGTNAPSQDVTWTVQVIIDDDNKGNQEVSTSQTYQSPSGIWHRSSINRGFDWSEWQSLINEPAMPLKKTETNDLNKIIQTGFYVGDGKDATNAPSSSNAWVLMVVAAPYGNQLYVAQTFYAGNDIWWRRSENNGSSWSDWTSTVNEPSMPLKVLSGTVDLNQLLDTGVYIGPGTAGTHAPAADPAWSVEVVAQMVSGQTHIIQTYKSESGTWWRSTSNSGNTWSEWHNDANAPSMPLKTLSGIVDLNQLHDTGVYIGTGSSPTSSPFFQGSEWFLEILARASFISQTFISADDRWSRYSLDRGETWSLWQDWHVDSSPMFIRYWEEVYSDDMDLDSAPANGFFYSSNKPAINGPTDSTLWTLMVTGAPIDNHPLDDSLLSQTFFDPNGVWYRSNPSYPGEWNDWINLTESSLPLRTLSGTVDLNQLRDTGVYIGPGTPGTHAPVSDTAWSVDVVAQTVSGQTHIIQTYKSESGTWWRSSSNGGSSWSEWHSGTGTDQNFFPLTNLGGSDHIDLNQFKKIGYYVGNGYQANNAPNDNGSWVLMVLAAPYSGNPTYMTQYFFTDRGIWWRRSENNGSTWSSWVNITSNDLVKAYGSAYLLGDAVIANNDFIPFTAMALSSDCQLDARTGEVILNQPGVYSLSLSLHLNNNQPASFVISLDGETPEHHSSLHYEPATSTFTGIQPAHVTGMIQCEAGQRIGVKNLTGHSVTLRHAIHGRKCKHEFTLTKIN